MKGLIVKAISGFYYVKTDDGIKECKARGRFRNIGESPLVGDYVDISLQGGKGTVEKIFDRNNFLLRPPIANVDKLFIISSAVTPSPNLLLIDRMTSLCEYKNIEPIIVFNKSDAGDIRYFAEKYRRVGYKTIECSTVNREGIDEIICELEGVVSAFTGNSGVGKSSILNVIFPNLKLSTGEVSDKLGRGRHTTRHTELFPHDFSGYVADTPGFSSFEIIGDGIDFREQLELCFPEFEKYIGNCRFTDCKHVGEKGCSICEACSNRDIDSDRYASYVTIFNELKDIKPWDIKRAQ